MKISTSAEANNEFDYSYSDRHELGEDLGTVVDACEDFLRFVLKMERLSERMPPAAAATD